MINLTIDDIFNKEFSVDFKGYSPIEVDQFLDTVMADYKTYEDTISELGARLAEYEKQVASLKAKLLEVEGQNMSKTMTVATPSAMSNSTQVDILKRIARLEQEVFGKMN